MGDVLEPLGVAAAEEVIYRALLLAPNSSQAAIAQVAGVAKNALPKSLKRLEDQGLVSRIPGRPVRYVPTPPDMAVEVIARQRIDGIERARSGIAQLIEEFHRGAEGVPEDVVQIVRGRAAVVQRFEQMQRNARDRVRILDRPPYARGNTLNSTELELLEQGLSFQVIYDIRAFEVPGQLQWIQQLVAAGEQARPFRTCR